MAPNTALPPEHTDLERSCFALWFVGRPAAGKSTLAHLLHQRLLDKGVVTCVLDSDELRAILTPQPTYDDAEREWFYAALVDLAALLVRNGVSVLIAATGQRQAYRAAAYQKIPHFAEVYVACSLDTCRTRDPKGLYSQAQAGTVKQLPGIDAVFEPPLSPALILDTEQQTPAEGVALVLTYLRRQFNL